MPAPTPVAINVSPDVFEFAPIAVKSVVPTVSILYSLPTTKLPADVVPSLASWPANTSILLSLLTAVTPVVAAAPLIAVTTSSIVVPPVAPVVTPLITKVVPLAIVNEPALALVFTGQLSYQSKSTVVAVFELSPNNTQTLLRFL